MFLNGFFIRCREVWADYISVSSVFSCYLRCLLAVQSLASGFCSDSNLPTDPILPFISTLQLPYPLCEQFLRQYNFLPEIKHFGCSFGIELTLIPQLFEGLAVKKLFVELIQCGVHFFLGHVVVLVDLYCFEGEKDLVQSQFYVLVGHNGYKYRVYLLCIIMRWNYFYSN